MQDNNLQHLMDVIGCCIQSIKNGDLTDAEPWILLEEKIGYSETLKLYESAEYQKLFHLLEDYCLNAQLGFANFKGGSPSDAEAILLNCAAKINDIVFINRELNKIIGHPSK